MTKEDFEKLVDNFYQTKEKADYYKDIASDCNTQIKNEMTALNSKEETVGNYKVKITVKDKTKFNPDRLLEFCKSLDCPGLIKTKEYVDETVLESFIYNNTLTENQLSELNSCRDFKYEEALRVTMRKDA